MIRKVSMLCKTKYEPENEDYGDCFLVEQEDRFSIIDCGSTELAKKAYNIIKLKNKYKIDIFVTHPDSDHYAGLKDLVSMIRNRPYTYSINIYYKTYRSVRGIIDRIKKDDGRRTEHSIESKLKNIYDGLESHISDIKKYYNVNIAEIDTEKSKEYNGIVVCGPNRYEITEIFRQYIDNQNTKFDDETVKNTLSLRLYMVCNRSAVIICGDYPICDKEGKIKYNIDEVVKKVRCKVPSGEINFVVPHHGKMMYTKSLIREYPSMDLVISDNKAKNKPGGFEYNMVNAADILHIKAISKESNKDERVICERG